MTARAQSFDPVFVLATTETGTEAALRTAVVRSECGSITLLVPHITSCETEGDRVKRWQTLAASYRARHAIAFPIVLVECEGRDVTEIVEQATPQHAVILIGGRATPSWRPWCSYPEWLAGWLARTGRAVEFVRENVDRRSSPLAPRRRRPGSPVASRLLLWTER